MTKYRFFATPFTFAFHHLILHYTDVLWSY